VKAIYGLYPDGPSAQQVVNRLRAAGLTDREITVCSSQPMEHYEFGQMDRATWIWWIACGGGLIGMASALALSWLTETSWPINVGGLPTFRLVAEPDHHVRVDDARGDHRHRHHLVVTARLGRGGKLYDPEVTEGKILVGVENPSESAAPALEAALRAVNGTVKRS
jgi:hypothetical protein